MLQGPAVEQLTAVVALDGPAGSGKSTVARLVAEALGWRFIDTGATYRAVTLAVLRQGVNLDDADRVAEVARAAVVRLGTGGQEPAVRLDGQDVSVEIRGPEVTAAVSQVSAIPAVREIMVDLQRRAIGVGRAVVEGRDIATVVAPRAAVKVYLDARPEVRARRRAADAESGVRAGESAGTPSGAPAGADRAGEGKGEDAKALAGHVHLELEVLRSLTHRDAQDEKTNALEPTEGAVHLDTSDLTLEEVVEVIVGWVRSAGLAGGAG